MIVDDTLRTSPRVEYILMQNYLAFVNATNLKDLPGAAQKINHWVSEITENRINDLVTESSLVDTVLMFLNALHFQGKIYSKKNDKFLKTGFQEDGKFHSK